jgi:hypothetical protein
MKGMALVCGIPHERFSELYWKLRPPYDRGDIDGPAYWTAVVSQQASVMNKYEMEGRHRGSHQEYAQPYRGPGHQPSRP